MLTLVYFASSGGKYCAGMYAAYWARVQGQIWHFCFPTCASRDFVDYHDHIRVPCNGSRDGNCGTRHHESSSSRRTYILAATNNM